MRTLILLSAMPGSGKSTWARAYQALHPHTYIVSSDEIRVELFGKAQDFRDEKMVWDTYLKRLNELGSKHDDATVIADATNLQNKYRRYYFEETPGFDRHVLVYFKVPYEVCCRQNKMRSSDRIVPDKAMEKLRAELEEPDEDTVNLYDEYLVIHNIDAYVK